MDEQKRFSKIKDFLKGFKEGQKSFGETIAALVNSVLLSIVYLLGVGLISLFAKIFGKHFLLTKIEENSKTYWEDLNLGKRPMGEYYRQF